MMAKFNNTKNYYDIIVPSEYLIQELIDEGKIEKLDYSKLPNVTKILPKILQTWNMILAIFIQCQPTGD